MPCINLATINILEFNKVYDAYIKYAHIKDKINKQRPWNVQCIDIDNSMHWLSSEDHKYHWQNIRNLEYRAILQNHSIKLTCISVFKDLLL